MVKHNYAFADFVKNTMAKVVGRNLSISHKDSREICTFVKGKKINRAITYLESVVKKKQPIPYKRFKKDIPHRKGKIATGRYPVNASFAILKLLSDLKSQAQGKGLDVPELIIIHAATHKGTRSWHSGRLRRRVRKITHVEFVAAEKKKVEDKKEVKK